ncbi:MAG: hypothetical protein LIP02_04105 [Bacteroidales bacterium]|nr:hypothetical protein [Bacteroidales bacterium]
MRPYTPAEKERIKTLYAEGCPARYIAALTGRTEHGVSQLLYRLHQWRDHHPRYRELTPEERGWMAANYPHVSDRVCALFLGCCEMTVKRKAKEMGLRKTPQLISDCARHAGRAPKRPRGGKSETA